MEKQLPKNWVKCSLGEIAEWGSGGTPNRGIPSYYNGTIPWLKTGDLNDGLITEVKEYITELGLKNSSAKIFPKNSVVIAMYGATIGKTGILNFASSTNQACAVAVPYFNMNKFIYLFLKSEKEKFIEKGKGGAQPNISQAVIKSHNINLPPLAEQNRIVEKLDNMFDQLETIKASMAKIPLLLKDFRQQVLSQAVTGKLTEQWSKGKDLENMYNYISKVSKQRNKDYEKEIIIAKKEKLKKPKKDFDFDFKKHPTKDNWCIAKLENLVYMSARIGWKGLKAEEYTEFGPLFISVHSLNYGENVNYEKAYHISEERYIESPEIMLEENDILLCKDGAGIGKIGIVKNLKERATVNSSLLVIRGREVINSKFLFYFFSGPTLQNIAKERITGTAIPHLFQKDIKEFYVEIPPLEEQQEIVNRVESLFDKADAIELQYKTLKNKIDTLPQALLHKAFKGELSEQLESDGDANHLLKEIQNLKTASKKVVNSKLKPKKTKVYSENKEVLAMVAEPK
jgi:type I restriction enzyme S subunit